MDYIQEIKPSIPTRIRIRKFGHCIVSSKNSPRGNNLRRLRIMRSALAPTRIRIREFGQTHKAEYVISANYSVLRASTGSFFAAMRDGTRPAIRVKEMLITTRMNAAATGS